MRRLVPLRHDADDAGPVARDALEYLGGEGHLHVIAVFGDPLVNDAMVERPPLRVHLLVIAHHSVERNGVGPRQEPQAGALVLPCHRDFGDAAHDGAGGRVLCENLAHVLDHRLLCGAQNVAAVSLHRAPERDRCSGGRGCASCIERCDLLRRRLPRPVLWQHDELLRNGIHSALDVGSHRAPQAQRRGLFLLPSVRVEHVERPDIGRRGKFHLPQHAARHRRAVAGLRMMAVETDVVEAGLRNLLAIGKRADLHSPTPAR